MRINRADVPDGIDIGQLGFCSLLDLGTASGMDEVFRLLIGESCQSVPTADTLLIVERPRDLWTSRRLPAEAKSRQASVTIGKALVSSHRLRLLGWLREQVGWRSRGS